MEIIVVLILIFVIIFYLNPNKGRRRCRCRGRCLCRQMECFTSPSSLTAQDERGEYEAAKVSQELSSWLQSKEGKRLTGTPIHQGAYGVPPSVFKPLEDLDNVIDPVVHMQRITPPNFRIKCTDPKENVRLYHCGIVASQGLGLVMVSNLSNFDSCYPDEEYTPVSAKIKTVIGAVNPNTLQYIPGATACGSKIRSHRISLMTNECPSSENVMDERPFILKTSLWTIGYIGQGSACMPVNVITRYSNLYEKNIQVPLKYTETGGLVDTRTGSSKLKNWGPFVYNGELHFIQSVNPHRILKCDVTTGVCEVAYTTNSPIRGLLESGQYVMPWGSHSNLGMTWTSRTQQYYVYFYLFSNTPPFNIIKFSKPIRMQKYAINASHTVYPSQCSVVGERLLLNVNMSDCHSFWLTINKDMLFSS